MVPLDPPLTAASGVCAQSSNAKRGIDQCVTAIDRRKQFASVTTHKSLEKNAVVFDLCEVAKKLGALFRWA